MIVVKVKLKDGNIYTHCPVSEYSLTENILKIKTFIPPAIHYQLSGVDSITINVEAPYQVRSMTAESR